VNTETTFGDVTPLFPDEAERRAQLTTLLALADPPPEEEKSPTGPWLVVPGTGTLFSAPHEARHIRDGRIKVAESGTGSLALGLARLTGGAGMATAPEQRGDPNWDPDHPYVSRMATLTSGWIVDLHMMRPRGVEVCVGLGPRPELSEPLCWPILEEALAAGLRTSVNWPFGASPRTVTGQLQRRGRRAIQLELSWDCFDTDHEAMPRAWSFLHRASRRLSDLSNSREDGQL